jgi:hypothetical protein
MTKENVMNLSVETAVWQDYRASNTGMVVFYSSDPVSEIPIREIPEEYPSAILPEPNYETGTYGFYGCSKSKVRNAFTKGKFRYLLFLTRYEGTRAEFKGKIFITGYYRINKFADVKKMHIRYLADYSCLDESNCNALRAEENHFVAIDDAFQVTDAVLKAWDVKSKVTRQTRVLLTEEQTKKVVDYLQSKPDSTSAYVEETKRLQPHAEEVSGDDEVEE